MCVCTPWVDKGVWLSNFFDNGNVLCCCNDWSLLQIVNEKNESSASDEDSFHLVGEKEKAGEDGPTCATVKKPKKAPQSSTQ